MGKPNDRDISRVMAELGKRGAAAKNGAMSAEQRKALATKAARVRWAAKRNPNGDSKKRGQLPE
jgi:hypothetical protein